MIKLAILFDTISTTNNKNFFDDENSANDNNENPPSNNPMESARIDDVIVSAPEILTNRQQNRQQKFCPYCCSYSAYEENFCSKCGLPLSDEIYKNTITSSTGQLTISLGAILENLESEVTTPKPMLIQSALGNALFIKPILTNEKFVRFYPDNHKIFKQSCSLDKFTVIDFETANMYPDSVCQIGIVRVENFEIVESKSVLIRPPYNDFRNSYLHGITLEDVKNSKTFAELWADIKPFFENKLIAAYNSNFDVGCLLATLENFKITPPNFAYFDILQNSRDILADKHLPSFKLSDVAKELNISVNHHDALSDSVAAAKIQLNFAMSEMSCHIFLADKNRYTDMVNLFTANEIFRHIKKLLLEKTPEEIRDYQSLISLLDIAQEKGADIAKVFKLKGSVFEFFGLKYLALDSYKQAFSINDKIGVKGRIQSLEKDLT